MMTSEIERLTKHSSQPLAVPMTSFQMTSTLKIRSNARAASGG
jgi:hypothetical protein